MRTRSVYTQRPFSCKTSTLTWFVWTLLSFFSGEYFECSLECFYIVASLLLLATISPPHSLFLSLSYAAGSAMWWQHKVCSFVHTFSFLKTRILNASRMYLHSLLRTHTNVVCKSSEDKKETEIQRVDRMENSQSKTSCVKNITFVKGAALIRLCGRSFYQLLLLLNCAHPP